MVSQGWLHRHWRAGFKASHLSWTTRPELQYLAVVKVHGVFPSNHGYSASSPRLQFHRIPRRDSAQVVTPFVQVGTSRFPLISEGADYPFTLTLLGESAHSELTCFLRERNSRQHYQGPASHRVRRFAANAARTRCHVPKDDQSLRGQPPSLEATSHGITLSLLRRP